MKYLPLRYAFWQSYILTSILVPFIAQKNTAINRFY